VIERLTGVGLRPAEIALALATADPGGASEGHPLRAPLLYPFKGELPVGSGEWRTAVEEFAQLSIEPRERGVMEFLQRLPNPLVVGLRRELTAPSSPRFHRATAQGAPAHAHAKELAATAYKTYQNKLIELNNYLKDKVMSATFEPIRSFPDPTSLPETAPISLSQVAVWEERVKRYLANGPQGSQLSDILNNTAAYFNEMRQWITGYKEALRANAAESRIAFVLQTLQFRRTQALIEIFEEFENASERAYSGIKNYLDALNKFFADSGKLLFFKRTTGDLCFRLMQEAKVDARPRRIESLSSGEKQLIILFTHLCFDGGNVFIIDEPELSLHPKWQEEFLPAFIKLTPPGTQLIMATHSAAVVGKNVRYCKTLLPYNS
jgi:predicted ATPase